MKKIAVVFVFLFCILFSGCGKSLDKVSKNLNTYTINAVFDEDTKTLACTQTVDYTNTTENLITTLPFHLYANAFREESIYKPVSFASEQKAYPNGKSYGGITIECIKVNGKQTSVEIGGVDDNIVNVKNLQLYPDDRVKIYFEYQVLLPNCLHRFGYGDNTYNFGNFYPIACVYDNGFMTKPYSYNGDPFFSDMANYNVTITAPSDFVIACSGESKKEKTTDDFTTYKITSKAIRDFAFVMSKKFKVIDKKLDDTIIKYYYFEDQNYNDSLMTAVDSVKTFNETFGKYPYKILNVVENDFLHGGMEYPCLVYISNLVKDYTEYKNVIVHEVAHQWWYGLVGNNEYDDAWLDEGLAEVSCLMFYDKNPSYGISVSGKKSLLMSNYAMFLDVFKSVYGSVDESMTRSLDKYISETEYTYITYVKGNIMFADLQEMIGKRRFEKALKKYFKDNIYTNAKPENLIAAFNSVAGKRCEKFINSYLNGKVTFATK